MLKKNMHGVAIKSTEEQIDELRSEIRKQMDILNDMNEQDGAIDRTCVQLSTLHSLFGRKHALMIQKDRCRIDLDRYTAKEG